MPKEYTAWLQVKAEHVVVAVGLEANTDLAATSGLEVDDQMGGYRTDAELRARTDVYVVRPFSAPEMGSSGVNVGTWDRLATAPPSTTSS